MIEEFKDKMFGCYNPFWKRINLGCDKSVYVPLPCGKCINCYKSYERIWTLRTLDHMQTNKSSFFLTLTYDNLNVPISKSGELVLCKRDYQLFLKRLRKFFNDVRITYMIVGEYGTKSNRPHYHFALFFSERIKIDLLRRVVLNLWSKGFIKLNFLNKDNIHYLTKYFNKIDDRVHEVPNFRHMSKGFSADSITSNYLRYIEYCYKNSLPLNRHGMTFPIPRYYIYDELKERYQEKRLTKLHEDYNKWLIGFINKFGYEDPRVHYKQNNDNAMRKSRIVGYNTYNDDDF